MCCAPSEVAPREVRFAHPRQAAPATPFTRSRAAMPPEEPPRTEPRTLALVRRKRFNAHEKVIFQGDVRGKRFITHERDIFQGVVREKRFITHGRNARRRGLRTERGRKNCRTMGQEIERKFLVRGEFKSSAKKAMRISQGYLSSVPERTVRIRVRDNQGFITVKGKSDIHGVSRFEWQKEISVDDALALLGLCEPGVIDKTRYLVDYAGHTFEVDEFYGDNEGLVMAEIELSCEDEAFEKPDWLGGEVTGDSRYYNAALTKNPYINWEK